MNRDEIKLRRKWSALFFTERDIDIRHLLVDNNYLEMLDFYQDLLNQDYIERTEGQYKLTEKGRNEKKRIEKLLNLKGSEKFISLDFNVLIESMRVDDLYY